MATISLKAYISRVDTLLTVGNLDEVVHHCRHILVSYPRNLEASHMLGQALAQMGGNSTECQAVLRRVLAISPDDAATHAALGEVNELSGLFEEAIWHLERASEHATENRSYRERLRTLYRLHRDSGAELPEGLPGAVARRQIREGQRVQAIRTLKDALKKEPGRQDLRVLLARTQWDTEKRMEAAETALDLLEALPWCLHANRIVASLWLAELRPSDARAFLERIHDVDPYLALRLASNAPADEHTYTLTELDYRQFGQNQPPVRQSPPTPGPGSSGSGFPERSDGYPSDITDGSLPDWLQHSVTAESESAELAWLEGDVPAASSAREGVLPWESGAAAPQSASMSASPVSNDGDELDWLNSPSTGAAQWHGEQAADWTAESGATWRDAPVTPQPVAGEPSGDAWRSPPGSLTGGPGTANSRQQQFIFSRLPQWLRGSTGSLPSLGRARNAGRRQSGTEDRR